MTGTTDLKFSATDWPIKHTLASFELWPPGQGAVREMLPLDLELRFDCERIETPNQTIRVSLVRADIAVLLDGLTVVRGSRFGDVINEPYDLYDLIDASNAQLEAETERKGGASFSLSRDVFGSLFATVTGRRRKSTSHALDRIGKFAAKQYRVVARNGNRWTVMEPRTPFIPNGRVLGIRSDAEKADPLCLLELRKVPATARVFVFVHQNDIRLEFEPNSGFALTRNKQVVASILARRAIQHSEINISGSVPSTDGGGIMLCYAELKCDGADAN
jgi:hypothetical protein